MTKHTDLIERLTDEAYEWSRYVTEDRAPSTLSDYLEPHIKAVANALEAQAREIAGLRKDAERPSVDYVFGKPPKYSLSYTDERDFCLAASPLIGATYVIGNDAAERINKSPWGRKTFGTVTATIHDAAMPQKGQP